jgi:hypothetical protein
MRSISFKEAWLTTLGMVIGFSLILGGVIYLVSFFNA